MSWSLEEAHHFRRRRPADGLEILGAPGLLDIDQTLREGLLVCLRYLEGGHAGADLILTGAEPLPVAAAAASRSEHRSLAGTGAAATKEAPEQPPYDEEQNEQLNQHAEEPAEAEAHMHEAAAEKQAEDAGADEAAKQTGHEGPSAEEGAAAHAHSRSADTAHRRLAALEGGGAGGEVCRTGRPVAEAAAAAERMAAAEAGIGGHDRNRPQQGQQGGKQNKKPAHGARELRQKVWVTI